MKLYATNIAEMVFRFYAMTAVILIAGFTGQWWLSIIGFALFFAALTGVKIRDKKSDEGGIVRHMTGDHRSSKAM